MTAAERELDLKHTADTPYLALTGELCSVCCEDFGEKCYNGTALYIPLLWKYGK